MLRRAQDDYWHAAAGMVGPGETFLGAAASELLEETGLPHSSYARSTGSPKDFHMRTRPTATRS